jgi:hypothetical protein
MNTRAIQKFRLGYKIFSRFAIYFRDFAYSPLPCSFRDYLSARARARAGSLAPQQIGWEHLVEIDVIGALGFAGC